MSKQRTARTPILNARVAGHGPVLVLLHGFLSSSEYWKEVVDLLTPDYTVIALDLLGFGKSPKPRRSDYDYRDQTDSINATLAQLNITEPFTLVGHSMGSLIALRYARVNGHRVKKLMLVNMPVMMGRHQVHEEIGNTSLAYKYGLQPYTHRLAWALFKTLFRLRLLSRETVKKLKQNSFFFQHSPLSRIRSYHRIIGEARADIDLNLIRVETLVISGIEDRNVYLENLQSNISLSPTVTLETFPTGHHIPLAMPTLLANRVSS